MKRTLAIITIIFMSLSITACSYFTKENDDQSLFQNAFDNTLDEKISYSKDLSGYDKIELNMDLTVSDVKIDVSNDHQLKYDQAANRQELLATVEYKEKGDTLIITFVNDKKVNIIAGSQTSKTQVMIPEGVEVKLDTNLDVGDMTINAKDITFTEITSNSDVGDINLFATKSQDQLSYISISSDVGDLNVNVDKGAKTLETIKLETNTGRIKTSLDGNYEEAITLTAHIDVGDVKLESKGNFEKQVEIDVKSSVGDVTISVPKNHEMSVKPSITEFTSSLDLEDIPFEKSKGEYLLDGNKSIFKIDLTVTVGDATILYAK